MMQIGRLTANLRDLVMTTLRVHQIRFSQDDVIEIIEAMRPHVAISKDAAIDAMEHQISKRQALVR